MTKKKIQEKKKKKKEEDDDEDERWRREKTTSPQGQTMHVLVVVVVVVVLFCLFVFNLPTFRVSNDESHKTQCTMYIILNILFPYSSSLRSSEWGNALINTC